MEPHRTIVVRPRLPASAIVVGVAAVGASLIMWWTAVIGLVAVVLVAWGFVFQQLLDRGRIRSVEFDPDGAVVLTSLMDRRRVDSAAIGAVGVSGTVVAGRLSVPLRGLDPLVAGRVVLVDDAGAVIAACRAGWIAVGELRAAVEAAGHPWWDERPLGRLPLAAPGPSGHGQSDPQAIDRALRAMRWGCRQVIVRWTVALAVLWAAAATCSWAGAPRAVMDPLRLSVVLGVIGWFVLLVTQPLRSRPARGSASVVARGSWTAVDVAMLRGAPVDPGVRVVGVIDPVSSVLLDTWIVEPSSSALWIQEFQRRRCHLAVRPDGRSAVLANGDCSRLALLVRTTGAGKAPELHDWARRQLAPATG